MALDHSPELRLTLVVILFSRVEHFSNFGRGSPKEHFCGIILKSGHWPRRRCGLIFSIFSFSGHFVQWSRTILTTLVEGHQRNFSAKFA